MSTTVFKCCVMRSTHLDTDIHTEYNRVQPTVQVRGLITNNKV